MSDGCKIGRCTYHCTCYQDIDFDKEGCEWCKTITENETFSHAIISLKAERNRYKAIADAAAEMMKQMPWGGTAEFFRAKESLANLLSEIKDKTNG